jgi:hypothetical protein
MNPELPNPVAERAGVSAERPSAATLRRATSETSDVAEVADPGLGSPSPATSKPSRLWLWFVAAFCLQVAAWTAWFVIAAQHKIEEVPLVGSAKAISDKR